LLLLARLGLALVPFTGLRSTLAATRRKDALAADTIERIGWSVGAAARRLPFRTTCLIDSLAADAMLRRRGYASEIRFGVRAPSGHALAAHAWVEIDGRLVYGAISDRSQYASLSTDLDVHRNGLSPRRGAQDSR
jgi:hypothetical protein